MSKLQSQFIDHHGRPAFAPTYFNATAFSEGVARVMQSGSYRVGLVDRSGHLVLKPCFDFIMDFSEGVARVNNGGWMEKGSVRGGKWGYVDTTGRVLVDPRFDFAWDFAEGLAGVQGEEGFGFIDRDGRWAVEPVYSYVSNHVDGLAVVSKGGKDGYIDARGALVIPLQFDEATTFRSGLARVKIEGKWGLIDRDGTVITRELYDRIGVPTGGAAWVVQGERCGIVDATGELLSGQWYDEIKQAGDGLWPVRQGELWGFVNAAGELLELGYQNALAHTQGLARVRTNDAWGFADARGKLVIEAKYEDAWSFSENRASVKRDGKWTFVDASGRELVPPRFETGSRYKDNVARVRVDGRWGFVDGTGAFVVVPRYDYAADYNEGYAVVQEVQRTSEPTGPIEGVHMLPAQGLRHPVFEGMGAADHLIAIIGYERNLEPDEMDAFHQRIEAWERAVGLVEGQLYTENKWVSTFNAYLRVQNLRDPVAEVSTFIEELRELGLPIKEIIFSRWGWPHGERAMGPIPDPASSLGQLAFDDFPAYWQSVWGRGHTHPATEHPFYLKGVMKVSDGLALEERGMPIHLDDVRVCFGAMQGQGEEYQPTDARTAMVAAAVIEAIDARFGEIWFKPGGYQWRPQIFNRQWDEGTLEKIEYAGKVGYSFAVTYKDLCQMFSPARMRYREPELMEALRQVIQQLDLAPIVMWQRFGEQMPMSPLSYPDFCVVQLWEK